MEIPTASLITLGLTVVAGSGAWFKMKGKADHAEVIAKDAKAEAVAVEARLRLDLVEHEESCQKNVVVHLENLSERLAKMDEGREKGREAFDKKFEKFDKKFEEIDKHMGATNATLKIILKNNHG